MSVHEAMEPCFADNLHLAVVARVSLRDPASRMAVQPQKKEKLSEMNAWSAGCLQKVPSSPGFKKKNDNYPLRL